MLVILSRLQLLAIASNFTFAGGLSNSVLNFLTSSGKNSDVWHIAILEDSAGFSLCTSFSHPETGIYSSYLDAKKFLISKNLRSKNINNLYGDE